MHSPSSQQHIQACQAGRAAVLQCGAAGARDGKPIWRGRPAGQGGGPACSRCRGSNEGSRGRKCQTLEPTSLESHCVQ
eukprot:scaffold304288_cov19-Tisochrysis_lutea.AAC.1